MAGFIAPPAGEPCPAVVPAPFESLGDDITSNSVVCCVYKLPQHTPHLTHLLPGAVEEVRVRHLLSALLCAMLQCARLAVFAWGLCCLWGAGVGGAKCSQPGSAPPADWPGPGLPRGGGLSSCQPSYWYPPCVARETAEGYLPSSMGSPECC